MTNMNNEWRMTLPIVKSYEKEVNGESRMVVAGIASGTQLDYDDERMATSAIAAFEKAIQEGITLPVTGAWSLIPLRSGHRKEWDDVLGWVVKSYVDEDHNLWIEAELDNTSKARDLYEKLTGISRPGRPTQLGFSIGGTIKKASRVWDNEHNKSIRVIEDIGLKEISVVGQPAYPPSYVEALTKSINWDEVPVEGEPSKESVMEEATKDVVITNTENPVEVSTTDPVQSGAVQTDPQVSDEVTTEKHEDLSAKVESLTQKVDQLTTAFSQLTLPQTTQEVTTEPEKSVKEEEVAESKEASSKEETVEMVEKAFETTLANALTTALAAFKTETIDPLLVELQAVKSTVNDIASAPVDKSFAVRQSKETESKIEKFNDLVAKDKKISPIGAALRVAFGD
jgi:HK97 family phage prohead protease